MTAERTNCDTSLGSYSGQLLVDAAFPALKLGTPADEAAHAAFEDVGRKR